MSWIISFAIGYLLLVAIMFAAQRSLLYPAGKERPDLSYVSGSGIEELRLDNGDGEVLLHWYRRAEDEQKPVVVVFHGNAGHIGHRAGKYWPFVERGFGLMLVGYRGYGGNPGSPTEDGLMKDARSVLDWLSSNGYPSDRLIIYGESLGTAVSVALAAERRDIAALILEAPPSSIAAVAQAKYWYLPAKWLLLDKWDSLGRIGRVEAPLFVVHGARDRVVGQRFGRQLFAAANEPKEGHFPEDRHHNDLWEDPIAEQQILDFAERYAFGNKAP